RLREAGRVGAGREGLLHRPGADAEAGGALREPRLRPRRAGPLGRRRPRPGRGRRAGPLGRQPPRPPGPRPPPGPPPRPPPRRAPAPARPRPGARAGCRSACALLRQRFGRTAVAGTANTVAWALVVAGEAGGPAADAVQLAARAVAATPGDHHYLNTLGAAH